MRAVPRRSDDWTEPLRGRGDWLDAVLDDVQVRVLDHSPPTPGERAALFGSAATAFAAQAQPDAGPGTVAVPEAPATLAGAAFASPLLVSVAAYLAVHDPDGKVPTSRDDLLAELVAHEDRHWQATARARNVELGDGDLRRRIVAVMGLQVDAQGFVVAVDGGPGHGFAAHSWAADTGDDGRDDLVAEGCDGAGGIGWDVVTP